MANGYIVVWIGRCTLIKKVVELTKCSYLRLQLLKAENQCLRCTESHIIRHTKSRCQNLESS